ncbi:MAG: hypothetical protein ACRDX9_15045 [Acidimicrobiia bacterium]
MSTRQTPRIAIVALVLVVTLPVAASADEVGPNDFRISEIGPNGDTGHAAGSAQVVYNPANALFLVVWHGDEVDGEFEVHGQLIADDGSQIGADFPISDMGDPGSTASGGFAPAAAYNSARNEFLVVWEGRDDDVETEIYGQRLNAGTGAPIGGNFRISDAGPPGSPINQAYAVDVAYNRVDDQYLVVWNANEGLGGLANGELEIYGQRLSSTGGDIGSNDFRISDMGTDGNAGYDGFAPAAVHNPIDNHYMVVWTGSDNQGALVAGEMEIFGQRLSAGGAALGSNDFRISDMGPDGNASFTTLLDNGPSLAHNPGTNQYLVVWEGDDNVGGLVDNEFEVFGQRLSASGAHVGANDARLTHQGADGVADASATAPSVVHDPEGGGYALVWTGIDSAGEPEIYTSRLGSGALPLETAGARVSDMGPDGNIGFAAGQPDLAPGRRPALIVWRGSDNTPPLVAGESEIFGQMYETTPDTVGLVDVTQGIWHLRNSAGTVTTFGYGNPGDLPIAGDWDGDGDATPGLYRQSDGFFYSRNSNSTGIADAECFAGNPEDVPVVGDWDRDGDDNLGIYRPSEQRFYLYTSTCVGAPMGAAQIQLLFGNPGDKPVAGDWDGDGIDEVGLHRESTGFFYWRNTLDTGIASGEIFFGDPNDRIISGDWGLVDGSDTPAIFRPSNITFYFRHTLTQGVADSEFPFPGAVPAWLPVAGTFGLD